MGMSLRPTWANIDLEAFRQNLLAVSRVLGKSTGILPVVKANAYGIGAIEASRIALSVPKVIGLGVATPDEALQIRDAGMTELTIVLGPSTPGATVTLVERGVSITVASLEGLWAAAEAGAKAGKRAGIHLKIDTGMSRIGFQVGKPLDEAINLYKSSSHLYLEGVFTHFASSDTDRDATVRQIRSFALAKEQIESAEVRPRYYHSSNSAAILAYPESHLDFVRPGIIIYGSVPRGVDSGSVSIAPVFSWHTRVSHLKTIPEGTGVGYGLTYVADRDMVIATLPVGYADGYPRCLSNRSYVLAHGKRLPLRGRVCMDQMMVDATAVSDIRVGDPVTLIGVDGEQSITVDELADLAGTIPHEILTGISARVPRIYEP